MPRSTNTITRTECQSTHATLMEKIDELTKTINQLAIDFASMPGKLVEKLDEKYAKKSVEEDVKDIKIKMDTRTYKWLENIIMALIGVGLTILVAKYKSLL